jgi:hypothetical protein
MRTSLRAVPDDDAGFLPPNCPDQKQPMAGRLSRVAGAREQILPKRQHRRHLNKTVHTAPFVDLEGTYEAQAEEILIFTSLTWFPR